MDDQQEQTVFDGIGIAISVLSVLIKAYPQFADWIRDLIDGKIDPISVRVADILPEESASRKAQHDLGG